MVEGNTDVIALRQAGVEPVVASMGTALTEAQLKELGRLTKRLFLCFDSDAAGEDATLRGMELASKQGFDVRVVALPSGKDPADDPTGFEAHLGAQSRIPSIACGSILDRTPDRQLAYLAVQEFLNGIPESPERHDAWRLANDRLGHDRAVARGRRLGAGVQPVSSKMIDADERLERRVLAGCVAHPDLGAPLAELTPEHFDSERNRRMRAHLLGGEDGRRREFVELIAELDAVAAAEAIDEQTAKELLLRLRERHLRRELADADPERAKELQDQLMRIRSAVSELV